MSSNYKEVPGGIPKEEAERFSTGITRVDNFVDSFQKQGLLPKRFAQVQGEVITLETFLEGKIRQTVEIGGKTAEQLERELEQAGINYAKDMLHSKNFTTLQASQELETVRVRVQDLGLTGILTRNGIYTRAQELGLELCPAEIGPHMRLIFKDQPIGEWFVIGMKPITGRHGLPSIFSLARDADGLWLNDFWAYPDYEWNPYSTFVFSLRKDTLKP